MLLSSLFVPLLAGIALAAPAATSISSSTTKAATTSTTTSTTTKATTSSTSTSTISSSTSTVPSVVVKDTYSCATQPAGLSLRPTTDTPAAFTKYSGFHGAAMTAPMPTGGYLIDFAAANQAISSSSYMTYFSLPSYDTQMCADYCTNTVGCKAYNIFFERDPSLNPAAACPNPASVTRVTCSLFSQPISQDLATNAGQWRGPYSGAQITQNFQVVIAGSNAYNKH